MEFYTKLQQIGSEGRKYYDDINDGGGSGGVMMMVMVVMMMMTVVVVVMVVVMMTMVMMVMMMMMMMVVMMVVVMVVVVWHLQVKAVRVECRARVLLAVGLVLGLTLVVVWLSVFTPVAHLDDCHSNNTVSPADTTHALN